MRSHSHVIQTPPFDNPCEHSAMVLRRLLLHVHLSKFDSQTLVGWTPRNCGEYQSHGAAPAVSCAPLEPLFALNLPTDSASVNTTLFGAKLTSLSVVGLVLGCSPGGAATACTASAHHWIAPCAHHLCRQVRAA